MDTVSIFGWIAAGSVLSSFYLKIMMPLHIAAMCSNVMFIIYAVLSDCGGQVISDKSIGC